jgi:HEPN domain-containing protein
MTQKTVNFLGLAFEDYIAARLLLRNGLLSQGVAVASTAVEKQLKALLAFHGVFTKRHLDPSLLAKVKKVEPELGTSLNTDFIKYLGKGFTLRYASIDSGEFGIVINQYRTLIELDATILTIDGGFKLHRNRELQETPLTKAINEKNPMVLEQNVPLGTTSIDTLFESPNKMHEIKIAKNLQTLSVQYDTEGLNIVGDFCKKTDIGFGKQQWQLALG